MSEIPENLPKIRLSNLGLHGQDIKVEKPREKSKYSILRNSMKVNTVQENQEGSTEKSVQ